MVMYHRKIGRLLSADTIILANMFENWRSCHRQFCSMISQRVIYNDGSRVGGRGDQEINRILGDKSDDPAEANYRNRDLKCTIHTY